MCSFHITSTLNLLHSLLRQEERREDLSNSNLSQLASFIH